MAVYSGEGSILGGKNSNKLLALKAAKPYSCYMPEVYSEGESQRVTNDSEGEGFGSAVSAQRESDPSPLRRALKKYLRKHKVVEPKMPTAAQDASIESVKTIIEKGDRE